MKTFYKTIKSVILLAVLPLVATAAASAHQWMNDDNPITAGVDSNLTATELGSARIHTVALNRAGAVEGRIASLNADSNETNGLAELSIFFVRNGEVAAETKTAEDGTFQVEGLDPGAYSFVATGDNGFAAYGVRVVATDVPESINVMEAAAVSPKLAMIKEILKNRLPAKVTELILETAEQTEGSEVVGSNRVQLTDNTLSGRVLPIVGDIKSVEGTYVHILRNDKKVAEVQADENGNFMVKDLEPGVYNFVAAGPNGFAAVGFQAVEGSSELGADLTTDSEEIPVAIPAAQDLAYDSGYSDSLDVCLTCGQDSGVIYDNMDYGYANNYVDYPIEYAGESVAYGGSCGGACGACGGYSGGGGGFAATGVGGRPLLWAGLAAAIAIPLALSGDDDDPDDPDGMSPNGSRYRRYR